MYAQTPPMPHLQHTPSFAKTNTHFEPDHRMPDSTPPLISPLPHRVILCRHTFICKKNFNINMRSNTAQSGLSAFLQKKIKKNFVNSKSVYTFAVY